MSEKKSAFLSGKLILCIAVAVCAVIAVIVFFALRARSTGYRDMLSLCTRFALVSAMFEGEQPCIILDDPFVNLDEIRLDNAMRFLKTLGEHKQLIYFTCHGSRT